MSMLAFNIFLDRWKHRHLSFAGGTDFRDHLLRAGLSYQDWRLTNAQVDTLNATPVQILAAPGAGLVNIVEGVLTRINFLTTAFELGSGVLSFLYTDGSGDKVAADVPNATVEAAATAYYRSVGLSVIGLANAKVVAKASADVTAGGGTIQGRIWYRTMKIADLDLT